MSTVSKYGSDRHITAVNNNKTTIIPSPSSIPSHRCTIRLLLSCFIPYSEALYTRHIFVYNSAKSAVQIYSYTFKCHNFIATIRTKYFWLENSTICMVHNMQHTLNQFSSLCFPHTIPKDSRIVEIFPVYLLLHEIHSKSSNLEYCFIQLHFIRDDFDFRIQ